MIFGRKLTEQNTCGLILYTTFAWNFSHSKNNSPPNIIRMRRMGWARHVARMGDSTGAYRVLMARSEGKNPHGIPRRWWEANFKIDLQKIQTAEVDWIDLAQDSDSWRAAVNAVMNLRVPWNAGNFLTSWGTVSFSRRTGLHGVRQLAS
jgi:hypothetical protein